LGKEGSESRMSWQAPVPLSRSHIVHDFNCGVESLDSWLKIRAFGAEGRSARTYVACGIGQRVAGYYCLSAYMVSIESLPKRLGRNMPRKSPIILLGRLVVDVGFKGKGLGKLLIRDAILRALSGSVIIGARALMIEALDDSAKEFYQSLGFVSFPPDSLSLFLPLDTFKQEV
jgi:GNAT superfamily N-acetyltransferase